MNYEQAMSKLAAYGQEHVLKYYDELSVEKQNWLLNQISTIDFSVLDTLKKEPSADERGKIEPLPVVQIPEIKVYRQQFLETGLEAVNQGKVGAVLLAGGMGTRLGSNAPKGTYDIGITQPVYIFQRLIENLLDVVKAADYWVPLYVMTSEKNYDATIRFMREHNFFGYNRESVTFFKQEMAPACDFNGKVYMEDKWKISTSPNGNGGWYSSMYKWGFAQRAMMEGVEWLNVFSVDNVLQRIADPRFVGAVINRNCAAGSKVVRKVAPDEKVGVMCLEDGKPSIVEYYELTEEMKQAVDDKGEPAYNYGVILNYVFRISDLEEIREKKLPLHVVKKKIAALDENGKMMDPQEPNGYKFEQLVLDMIHELDSCLPYEVVRSREFAPVKNATGVDSVDTARELCLRNGIML